MGPRDVPIFIERGRGDRPSEGIVGDVRGVDPEGIAVQFLPVAEGYRTETAVQTFPRRGSGIIALGEDLLHDGADHFQPTWPIRNASSISAAKVSDRCWGFSVSEVVFQVLDVLQRVERLVLDLPTAASRAGQLAGVVGADRQIRDPSERPPILHPMAFGLAERDPGL